MYKSNKVDQMYALLKERIGNMADGELFPSVRQLMEIYGVSQFSVAPAVKNLQEQGYLESHIGRGTFVRKRPAERQFKVTVLSPEWPSETINQMLTIMLRKLDEHNYRHEVIKYDVRKDVFALLKGLKTDAVILEPVSYDHITAAQLHALVQSTVPVVLSRAKVAVQNVKYVTGNDAIAGMQMANYLHRNGHRELAFLISEPMNSMVEELQSGFMTYAHDNDCRCRILDCGIIQGEDAVAKTGKFMEHYLKSHKLDFSALAVVSHEPAIAALDVLQKYGIYVPEKLSVIASGNLNLPGPLGKLLTAVGPSMEKMVNAVVGIVEKQLTGNFNGRSQICIEPEVFERNSVIKRLAETRTPEKRREILVTA